MQACEDVDTCVEATEDGWVWPKGSILAPERARSIWLSAGCNQPPAHLQEFGYRYSPSGLHGQESACIEGDPGSIPGSERSPEDGNDSPLQYYCLENSMDRGAWGLAGYSPWGHKESDTTE